MNPDGTGQTNLTEDSGSDGYPAWSPDAQKIAFSSDRDDDDEIYVMNADGNGVTKLTDNTGYHDIAPDWQPILEPTPTPTSPPPHRLSGDVDCDGDVDPVDALLDLRHVAQLPYTLPPGCPEIGS